MTIDLDEAERLANAAHGGPWTASFGVGRATVYLDGGGPIIAEAIRDDDARFIAFVRTFVPAAVARIRGLEADLAASRAGHADTERELRAALAAEREVHEKTRTQLTCGTCGNAGPHPSGLTCICGGTGRMEDEARNARLAAIEALQERDAAIARAEAAERERDEARAEIERLEAIEMPADVEQAFERGWSARAAATRRAERERDEARAQAAGIPAAAREIEQSFRATIEHLPPATRRSLGVLGNLIARLGALDAGAPLLAELRALRAVRDAAERVVTEEQRYDGGDDSTSQINACYEAHERLRAALDAAKGGG